MHRWKESFSASSAHPLFNGILALMFLVPAFGTVGQFISSGFFSQTIRVDLLFWPGKTSSLALPFVVWIPMGAMMLSYAVGIGWLFKKRSLGIVTLIAIGGMIFAQSAGALVNHFTGWKELQQMTSMDLAGKANRVIFTLWHNPAWEEVVFRGIPLLILLVIVKKKPSVSSAALAVYFLLPAIIMAWYHVPNHGSSRIVDTFILSLVLSWMGYRYGFFAPLIIHYIFDAMMVISFSKIPSIKPDEITWLIDNNGILNTSWSFLMMGGFISFLVLILWTKFHPVGAFNRPVGSTSST